MNPTEGLREKLKQARRELNMARHECKRLRIQEASAQERIAAAHRMAANATSEVAGMKTLFLRNAAETLSPALRFLAAGRTEEAWDNLMVLVGYVKANGLAIDVPQVRP